MGLKDDPIKSQYRSTTIEKALSVLELFKERDKMSFTDIREELELNKTTLFRILHTLEVNGYLSRDMNKRYFLGVNVFILGNSFSRGKYISGVFASYMYRLTAQLNLTSHLGVLEGSEIVIIGKKDPSRSIKMFSRIGSVVPAHCTGQGKAILAHLPEPHVKMIVKKHGLTRFTANTITDVDGLFRELREIKARGYAFDDSEHEQHICCLAVPVLGLDGQIEAALSVTGIAVEFDNGEKISNITRHLKAIVAECSKKLGFV